MFIQKESATDLYLIDNNGKSIWVEYMVDGAYNQQGTYCYVHINLTRYFFSSKKVIEELILLRLEGCKVDKETIQYVVNWVNITKGYYVKLDKWHDIDYKVLL